jgi:CBS domain-containing protein
MHNKHNYHFQKSELIDLDINSKITDLVEIVNENNFNLIALSTNEKTQLQGMINTHDIMTFLLNNYKGEIDFFRHKFSKFETNSNISYFSHNSNLVKANYTDTLYEVLMKLRDNRVSMIAIERSFISAKT